MLSFISGIKVPVSLWWKSFDYDSLTLLARALPAVTSEGEGQLSWEKDNH